MEVIVTLHIVNTVALTIVRYQELKLVQKWKRGELSYDVLLACKRQKILSVRKLNPSVKMGRHPGLFKKDD